ncbi:MAG: sporulation protein YunB [Oscillospiraceae bacterium]|nr:sporulation protein YunB [Oscillospiraceae bacterium]
MKLWLLRFRRRNRKWIALVCAALILCGAAWLLVTQMQPLIARVAVTRVSNQVNRIISAAVSDAVSRGEVEYERLISFQKDNDGRITAISSNMAEFNRLQCLIDAEILAKLSDISTSTISIPVGTLTGVTLLSGRGPSLAVKMQSVGSSVSRFENEFTSAGINQTKHRVVLYVDVGVSVLLPGFRTATQVSGAYVVAETVIVGSVPDNYTYFSGTMEEVEDSIINDT